MKTNKTMKTKQKNMTMKKLRIQTMLMSSLLLLHLLFTCNLPLRAHTITDLTWLYTTGIHVDVTRIDYGKNTTTVYFSTCGHTDSPLTIRRDMYIVGDDGLRHLSKGSRNIEFGTSYELGHGKRMEFSIDFEPVKATNRVLDVRNPGQFSIFGLHDEGIQLVIPKAVGEVPTEESDYSLFVQGDVEIEGILHDPTHELGNIVQMNYIAPRNEPQQRSTQASKTDDDGHFSMRFNMYGPQNISILQPYAHGFMGSIYARPGDKIYVELYDPQENAVMEYKNMSGRKEYNKLGYAPAWSVQRNKYHGNLRPDSRFMVASYESQYSELMEKYSKILEFADYVCWHYNLSPFETLLYQYDIHSEFLNLLLATDIGAYYQLTDTKVQQEKEKYATIVAKMNYYYLRNIDPNSPMLATDQGMILIPSLLYQTALIQQCISQVPADDANRLQKVVGLQKDALERVAGWKGQTLMLELLIVQDFFRMEGIDLDDKANVSSARELLHHPYSRQCFDIYYADYTSKQTK